MSADLRLSVVICTRNRAALLREALRSLLEQDYPSARYEVVLVDNGSTDDTPALVREIAARATHVRYASCPERGLPKARVCGAMHARGPVVGYLDDDARADAGWLRRAEAIVREKNPVCFGGPFFARYDTPKPEWFRDAYGSVTHGPAARWLRDDEWLCGGNIFFRRDALEAAGGFDAAFSRSSDAFTYGEEQVPQFRLRATFPAERFYYDPELFILHLVRPERMSVRRGVRETFEMGRGYGKLVLAGRKETLRFPFFWRLVYRSARFGLRSAFCAPFRDRTRYPYWQNFIYEETAQEMRTAGMLYEHYLSAAQNRPTTPGAK